jgi:murein L,D-transpeptidase YcbB/YkuD
VNPIYAQLREAAWSQLQVPGGVVDGRLVANLARARMLPQSGRYVIVDNATQRLFMYQDGQLQDSMKVVVGKRATPTPLVVSTISYATFNPYWNIPTDVVRRTVAPAVVKKGVAHLKASNFEVASDWTDQATTVAPDTVDWKAVAAGTQEIRIRQLPGKKNMMGAMKFNFPNADGIYLHDSPLRDLFTKPQRNFSLGCIRLEDAPRLAQWLLGREPVPPSADPEQHVKLPKSVPVYVTYLTAHAENGQVTFAQDVYGLDAAQSASRLAAAN